MKPWWLVATFLFVPASAHADDPDIDPASRARAEALFAEGVDLLERGDTRAACPKLEGAVALTRGDALGGKIVLARCYEKAGRTASAWGLYREVGARASKAGQEDRAREAAQRAEALAPLLRNLRLELSPAISALPSLEVWIGERALPKGSYTSPLPVDPGELTIELRAEGSRPSRQTLTIPAAPGESVVTFEGSLERVSLPPPTLPPPRSIAPPSFWSTQRVIGLTVGLVGVAGLGAGGVLAGVAKSDYDEALLAGGCTGSPPVCDDAAPARAAEDLGDVATVVFLSGAGVAALGTILFLTAPYAENDDAAVSAVSLHAGPRGLTLRGSF